jgi:hypothetical protein
VGRPIKELKQIIMTTLDEVLSYYETPKQTTETEDIPREQTAQETELLTDYTLNGNLQAIYDYYELKARLDKEWVDNQMLIRDRFSSISYY